MESGAETRASVAPLLGLDLATLIRALNKSMGDDEFRHTGLWPFNLFPDLRGQSSRGDAGNGSVKVFDPIALAYDAGSKLVSAGWVGLALMPTPFLWNVVDANPEDVGALVSKWVSDHQSAIADAFEQRLTSYTVDDLAKQATAEALHAYRANHCLATVRTLMPEFERFGRMVVQTDGTLPKNQKQAVTAIQNYLGEVPAGHYATIESLTGFKIISEDLFARCLTQEDAQQLGAGPNRHAELHGLDSYGDLQGATKMICANDLMLNAVTFAKVAAIVA